MNPGSANSVSSRDTSSWLYRCAVDATAVPAMCGALRRWWAAGFMDVEFVVAVMPITTTCALSKADRGQGELEHNPPPTETRHHDDGTAAAHQLFTRANAAESSGVQPASPDWTFGQYASGIQRTNLRPYSQNIVNEQDAAATAGA
jgi:hypothetical protein